MSVFTFDPDPPRVLSPWPPPKQPNDACASGSPSPLLTERYGVTRLPPEPQDGPIEYKLHLLLRPRRPYRTTTTTTTTTTDPQYLQQTRVVASTTAGQTRQDRCQHLTTQLLWRLRQSSPYHASVAAHSSADVVLPLLPDDATLSTLPVTLGKLAPGLEESHGALYEIGVADDGTLAGITREELDQSIATLRWMAANLGCVSEVQRMVVVGECEWTDEDDPDGWPPRRASLWVAEVFVRPHLHGTPVGSAEVAVTDDDTTQRIQGVPMTTTTTLGSSTTDQLRVTLTGPTGSGKSTLLGTLSTGTLDDGHGKSRLHSLKHRHEMDSGLTSTVTQELVGYTEDRAIVNYANPNIESWIGIHDYTKNGRLVFLSDSAGHPRFRRTTLRGLVGWAPHWTLLCLSAATDANAAESTATSFPGSGGSSSGGSFGLSSSSVAAADYISGGAGSAALAKAHLDLCLDLDLPLVVLITKSDLLTKESLKRKLTPIWTAVKRAGRTPLLLQSRQKAPEDARVLAPDDLQAVERVLAQIGGGGGDAQNARAAVPVVLTSAASGDGIGLVHALLRGLPRPPAPTAHDPAQPQPDALFHIGDRFSRPASYAAAGLGQTADPGHVVSGYLRFGSLSVGDRVVMGPFPVNAADNGNGTDTPAAGDASESDAHPSSASPWEPAPIAAAVTTEPTREWYAARIVSIRNLRLPVQTLAADQVGTIGLVVDAGSGGGGGAPRLKPRRGMVLAMPSPQQSQQQSQQQQHMADHGLGLQAARGLTACFGNEHVGLLAAGTLVTFYVASVRAQARIVGIWRTEGQVDAPNGYHVQLELLLGREWIELGGKIVLLEGASREGYLLDGFIGRVVALAE